MAVGLPPDRRDQNVGSFPVFLQLVIRPATERVQAPGPHTVMNTLAYDIGPFLAEIPLVIHTREINKVPASKFAHPSPA